ncbi:hypothetical protein FB107DRAFT_278961 [Schizophyllum commune]
MSPSSRCTRYVAIISLHAISRAVEGDGICRAVEVHRKPAEPWDGTTSGQAAAEEGTAEEGTADEGTADEGIDFLSAQALLAALHPGALLATLHHGALLAAPHHGALLAALHHGALLAILHHGSLGTTRKTVGSSCVSMLSFSALVARCRPATSGSLKLSSCDIGVAQAEWIVRDRQGSSSSILADLGSLFRPLAKLLRAPDDECEEPFGSSGPVSRNSSSSLATPLLPASPAASSHYSSHYSSSSPSADDQAKLDIVRAMEQLAAVQFSAVVTAGLLDDLEPLAFLRPVVVTILDDPRPLVVTIVADPRRDHRGRPSS